MPKEGSGQGMTSIRVAMVSWPPGDMAQLSVTWNVRKEPALRAADCSVGIVLVMVNRLTFDSLCTDCISVSF